MATSRLRLPTRSSSSTPSHTEVLAAEDSKIRLAQIKAGSGVEMARLQVMKEGLALLGSIADVAKSWNNLQATRAEWDGRVKQAEVQVKAAEIALQQVQSETSRHMAELEAFKQSQSALLRLFDAAMDDLSNNALDAEKKAESMRFLLQLADLIVKLKK